MPLPYVFVACPSLENLADRLAHCFGGTSLKAPQVGVACAKLVIISDGVDLEHVLAIYPTVKARAVVVLSVGAPENVVPWAFPDALHVNLDGDAPAMLWRQAQVALASPKTTVAALPRPNVFVSHAVDDEPAILPIVDALRDHFSIPVFVCADSISAGTNWHAEIRGHLERCDVFVFVTSAKANQSTFCAFEAGLAVGMGKPIFIVSLDGGAPPAHLQHIQAADIPRLIKNKPWLNDEDALLETVLDALGAVVVA